MEFVAAAVGIGKLFGGLFGSGKQKKIDKRQAELSYKSNLEDIRRRKFDQDQTLGQSTLQVEASGVRQTGGSTAQRFLDVMADEFKKELGFMQQYADEARQLGLKQAKLNYQTGVLNAVTGGIQSYVGLKG